MFDNEKIRVNDLAPSQKVGAKNDSFAWKDFESPEDARQFFQKIIQRLSDITNWGEYAGLDQEAFQLTDAAGTPKPSPPELQDKIRIRLPGFKNSAGEGYDWVEIVKTENGTLADTEFFLLQLTACDCPYTPGDKTAHFYAENATNTYVAALKGNTVQISVHSRNERPNTDTPNLLDKARNLMMAGSAMVAVSKIQWDTFTENLIKDDK